MILLFGCLLVSCLVAFIAWNTLDMYDHEQWSTFSRAWRVAIYAIGWPVCMAYVLVVVIYSSILGK